MTKNQLNAPPVASVLLVNAVTVSAGVTVTGAGNAAPARNANAAPASNTPKAMARNRPARPLLSATGIPFVVVPRCHGLEETVWVVAPNGDRVPGSLPTGNPEDA